MTEDQGDVRPEIYGRTDAGKLMNGIKVWHCGKDTTGHEFVSNGFWMVWWTASW